MSKTVGDIKKALATFASRLPVDERADYDQLCAMAALQEQSAAVIQRLHGALAAAFDQAQEAFAASSKEEVPVAPVIEPTPVAKKRSPPKKVESSSIATSADSSQQSLEDLQWAILALIRRRGSASRGDILVELQESVSRVRVACENLRAANLIVLVGSRGAAKYHVARSTQK